MKVETRGILIGMGLGDAHINVRYRMQNGKYPYVSAEMRIVHSIKQLDYCQHKAGLVKQHLGGNFSVTFGMGGPGKRYRYCAFSVSNPYFRQVQQWLYVGKVKTFSRHVLDMLTPEGIAIWYMDDGSAEHNRNKEGWISSVSTSIATMCSHDEAVIIQNFFKEEYGILFSLCFDKRRPDGKQWFIRANTHNSKEFVGLIQPYIIPSMLYKIAHVANLGLHENRAPIAFCACGSPIYDNRRLGLCNRCYANRYYRQVRRFRENRKPSGKIMGDDIVRTCENLQSQEVKDKEP